MKEKVRFYYGKLKTELVTYWDKPHKDEFLSYKQFVRFCVGGMGIDTFAFAAGLIGFFSGYYCGSIMGIAIRDFTVVSVTWTVLTYIFLPFSPLGMLIYENHGRLNRREKKIFLAYNGVRALVGVTCYILPSVLGESAMAFFNNILPGFLLVVGNMFVVSVVMDFIGWGIRYYFCPKHGRVKPFVVLYAIPAILMYSIIPWLPITKEMPYAQRIMILHLLFSFAGNFNGGYQSFYGMVNFMTQNTQERQRVFSIAPIPVGLINSIFGLIFPILINKVTLFGHTFMNYEDIWAYRVFIPIMGIISIALGSVFLPVKEQLIEQKIERPKVKFAEGARKVLKNKYLWIQNISGFLGCFGFVGVAIVNWWIIYSIRTAWVEGLVVGFIAFGSVGANIITPILTKRFEKQKIYVWGRLALVCTTAVCMLLYKVNLMWVYVVFSFFITALNTVVGGIGRGLGGDIMDYHQWRFGERCDSTSGVIGWFFSPPTLALSFVGPLILQNLGFTSDYGVLYDRVILDKLFTYSFLFSMLGGTLSLIPYFFYDLTSEKHRFYVAEIKERVKHADLEALKHHIRDGSYLNYDKDLLARLADEGIDVDAVVAEVQAEGEDVVDDYVAPAEVIA